MAIVAVAPPNLAVLNLALADVGSSSWPSFDGASIDQTDQKLRDFNQPQDREHQEITAMCTLLPPKWSSLWLLFRVLLSPVNPMTVAKTTPLAVRVVSRREHVLHSCGGVKPGRTLCNVMLLVSMCALPLRYAVCTIGSEALEPNTTSENHYDFSYRPHCTC